MKKTITEQLRELGLNPKQIKKIFNHYNHLGIKVSKRFVKTAIVESGWIYFYVNEEDSQWFGTITAISTDYIF